MLREQAELFAREHHLLYIDECSALAGINIDETFIALAEAIRGAQMLLVDRGDKNLGALKMKESDTSMEPDVKHRCCY